jgi:hypothetical protein
MRMSLVLSYHSRDYNTVQAEMDRRNVKGGEHRPLQRRARLSQRRTVWWDPFQRQSTLPRRTPRDECASSPPEHDALDTPGIPLVRERFDTINIF